MKQKNAPKTGGRKKGIIILIIVALLLVILGVVFYAVVWRQKAQETNPTGQQPMSLS